MYFFVPLLLRKPIWSHALSLIGFWGLAFFYPMQGVHHFLLSPIPMYAQYGAVVATIAVEIVVFTVIVNFFGTLHGRSDAIRGNLAIRWFYTGMVIYAITCFQCAFQVTLTFQKIIHFTDWVVAHAHMVMFGVFGFWIIGMFVELWPRAVGRPWVGAAAAHRALLADARSGSSLMVIDLTAAGLVQGFSWAGLAHWGESVVASMPFWWARTVAGLLIIAGQGLFFWALWATARQPAGAPEPDAVAAGGGGGALMERFGASFLIAGVLTFLLGFFLQGLMPVITLRKLPIADGRGDRAARPARVRPAGARTIPDEFRRDFGTPGPESFAQRAAAREGEVHRRGLLALPLAVRAPGLEGGPALRPGVDGRRVPEPDEPAASLRHAARRARSDPRGGQALERLAHGAPLRSAQRRAVLGDAGVPVVLRRRPAPDRARRSRSSPTCSGSGAGSRRSRRRLQPRRCRRDR